MPRRLCHLATALVVMLVMLTTNGAQAADTPGRDFLMLDRTLGRRPIRLVEINDRQLVYTLDTENWKTVELSDCIGLLSLDASVSSGQAGCLFLADGQVLPGRLVLDAPSSESTVRWHHPRLGRASIPVDQVCAISLSGSVDGCSTEVHDSDVVVLANGDRLEGFVAEFADPLILEVDAPAGVETRRLPMAQIASLHLVTKHRRPEGTRLWFDDGTVINTRTLRAGDDGIVRMSWQWPDHPDPNPPLKLEEVRAILFDASLVWPLSSVEPSRVEGPETRYYIPRPAVTAGDAPGGLDSITFCGPIAVTYELPRGASRFAADAVLPETARGLGDFELVIGVDGEEVFRRRLNSASPRAQINVPVAGSELTIEIAEGANGPVQDQLRLDLPAILVN